MMNSRIAEIAVEKAAYSFDKAFDYVIPDSMLDKAVAGTRVLVPFGRGNRPCHPTAAQSLLRMQRDLRRLLFRKKDTRQGAVCPSPCGCRDSAEIRRGNRKHIKRSEGSSLLGNTPSLFCFFFYAYSTFARKSFVLGF